jgi:hypothetical protein
MPRLSSATETRHPSNSAVYTNDVDSSVVLVTPVRGGLFRHSLSFLCASTRRRTIHCATGRSFVPVVMMVFKYVLRLNLVSASAGFQLVRRNASCSISMRPYASLTTTGSIINRFSSVVDDFVMTPNSERLSLYMSMSTLCFRIVCISCFSEYSASNTSAKAIVSLSSTDIVTRRDLRDDQTIG